MAWFMSFASITKIPRSGGRAAAARQPGVHVRAAVAELERGGVLFAFERLAGNGVARLGEQLVVGSALGEEGLPLVKREGPPRLGIHVSEADVSHG